MGRLLFPILSSFFISEESVERIRRNNSLTKRLNVRLTDSQTDRETDHQSFKPSSSSLFIQTSCDHPQVQSVVM